MFRNPWRTIGAVALVVLALVVGALIVAGSQSRKPQPVPLGPAANGLIAYSYDGDIYVADPVTGATTRIVSGPEYETNPIFSPDGTRIAFVRGNPVWGPASLLVVRVDGSGERVVVPEKPSSTDPIHRGVGPFAWTPDGTAIVVEVDLPPYTGHHDGELALFDASGRAEPRLLAPPLTKQIGAIYFNPSAQVAPMFRPPDGDLILDTSDDPFRVFDATLTSSRQLGGESLARYEPYFVRDPTWSPDGTMIAVLLNDGLFVMNADDGDLRQLGPPGLNQMWSPDSSSIAYEATGLGWHLGDPAEEVRIAVIDLASGTERVLESSVSPVKEGAAFATITNNEFHTWYYEGWSWSPDGRSLLLLKDHRTRPVVVDVATDTATELPWEADSNPSWQRIAP